MKLEERYIVLKYSDLLRLFNNDEYEMQHILWVARHVDEHRKAEGKGTLRGVFIEEDWPEYGLVVEMLNKRIMSHGNK